MTTEQWIIWAVPIVSAAITAIWLFFVKVWFPNQQENQKRRHDEAQRQRDHEQALLELTAKGKLEQNRDEQEYLQKTQGDALQAVLGISTKLIEHLIEQGNGRATEQTRLMTQMSNSLVRMEGMVSAANRDWSRHNEIVGDIDIEMHVMKDMLKTILIKHGIEYVEEES